MLRLREALGHGGIKEDVWGRGAGAWGISVMSCCGPIDVTTTVFSLFFKC